ncbi:MAG: hypothetical protein GKR86_04190 [Ilumatobacter sp.]|nr:hypothetical protein [Ilumatobacter sp.]
MAGGSGVTLHHPTTMHDPHGPLYSVVCTDTNPYGTWQTEFLEHTWVRSQMPGELIRLVGTPNGEEPPAHRTARVITTAATNTHPRLTSDYTGLNRLHSLSEWLENERPVGTVLILDCDFAFRAPLDRHALPEHPIGQLWWDVRWDGRWLELAESITSGIGGSLQQVTWPLIIHTSDLRRIIDRWVELTARIRAETNAWESDMFALPIVLAEYELHCELDMLAAWMPWPDDVVGDAPIIHYCQPVLDHDGETLWYKQQYTPWEPTGADTDEVALDYCGELLTMLDRYAALRRLAGDR